MKDEDRWTNGNVTGINSGIPLSVSAPSITQYSVSDMAIAMTKSSIRAGVMLVKRPDTAGEFSSSE